MIFQLLVVVFASCVDPLDLEIPGSAETDVVVNGKLVYGDPSTITVEVGEVFGFVGKQNRLSVRCVELIDSDGNSCRIEKENDVGLYAKIISKNDPEISISPDKLYSIKVLLANGDEIQSNFQNIYRVPRNNKVRDETFTLIEEADDGSFLDFPGIKFFIDSQIPSNRDIKLKYDIKRTYKFSNILNPLIPIQPKNTGFCLNASSGRVDICDLLRRVPDDPSGIHDCDGGGVSNAVECDRGTDPLNRLDDDNLTFISFVRACDIHIEVDIPLSTTVIKSCYLTNYENQFKVSLYDPALDNSSNTVFAYELFESNLDFKFAEGYNFQVITETLNAEMYEFYDKVNELISLRGSMFDPPAARISGNLKNLSNEESTVHGVFYATEHDTINYFIEPTTDIQNLFCTQCFVLGAPECRVGEDKRYEPPETCLDCTQWANQREDVSLMRPDFWPEN